MINLRRERKRRARAAADHESAAQRSAPGITARQQDLARAERNLAEKRLAAHRIDTPSTDHDD